MSSEKSPFSFIPTDTVAVSLLYRQCAAVTTHLKLSQNLFSQISPSIPFDQHFCSFLKKEMLESTYSSLIKDPLHSLSSKSKNTKNGKSLGLLVKPFKIRGSIEKPWLMATNDDRNTNRNRVIVEFLERRNVMSDTVQYRGALKRIWLRTFRETIQHGMKMPWKQRQERDKNQEFLSE